MWLTYLEALVRLFRVLFFFSFSFWWERFTRRTTSQRSATAGRTAFTSNLIVHLLRHTSRRNVYRFWDGSRSTRTLSDIGLLITLCPLADRRWVERLICIFEVYKTS